MWSAEEALLGSVKQEMSFGFPCFTVRDSYDNILYRIEGHNNTCSCNYATEAHFKVYLKFYLVFTASISNFIH